MVSNLSNEQTIRLYKNKGGGGLILRFQAINLGVYYILE